MKTFFKSVAFSVIAILSLGSCEAQINNALTASVTVYGNCGMCKKRIEKAAYIDGVAKAEWDADSGQAKITIDSTKTSLPEVLKRIAKVGHDSDEFRAEDTAYDNLAGCCQYDRPAKKQD